MIENIGRGLGIIVQCDGNDNWYRWKIQQVARIVKARTTFKFELEKPEISNVNCVVQ
jgi:RNA-dependent RNA polymerase